MNPKRLKQLIPLVRERAERMSDLLPLVNYLLGNLHELSEADFAHKSLQRAEVLKILHHTLSAFDEMRRWQRDDLFNLCQQLAAAMDLKFRDFLFPLFIATSGRAVSLPLFDSWIFLGADLSRARLRAGLDALGVSNKERKRLDKEYQALLPLGAQDL